MALSDRPGSASLPGMTVPVSPRSGTGSLRGEQRREARAAYVYLLPVFVLFVVFVAGPLIASVVLSFTRYDVVSEPVGIGLDNYQRLAGDERVIISFRNTFVFVILSTLLEITIALLLAVGVQSRMPTFLRYVFRTAFFLPVITSSTAIAIIFSYMFSRDFGVINYYLVQLGFERVPWLNSTQWSLFTIVLASVWQRLGFTFILFVAGLQNIPRDIYEAASIDGVGPFTRLRTLTIPLLSPTILFATVIGVIASLQVFETPFIMTRGGPGDSSRTVVMMIQESAFQNLEFGYGSAIAVILFVVIMLFTLLQFWMSQRWVHYQ